MRLLRRHRNATVHNKESGAFWNPDAWTKTLGKTCVSVTFMSEAKQICAPALYSRKDWQLPRNWTGINEGTPKGGSDLKG